MKKKLGLVILALVLAVTSAACAAKQAATESRDGSVAPPPIISPGIPGAAITAPMPTQAPTPAPGELIDSDRKIVRTGNLSLVVEDVEQSVSEIAGIAGASGGFVVSSQSFLVGKNLRGTISVRVPAESFDQVMAAISRLAVEVISQTTNAQDVTEEFTDLQARLRNLEATEQQLLAIMGRAEKVDEVLAVQRELSNTRSQIEQTKGRIQLLERTTATSLIQVTLEQSRLEVNFSATRVAVRTGEAVVFIPEIAGGFPPYSYRWDFGDKETRTNNAPAHAYRTAGEYDITLTVTDDRGNTATKTRESYILVTGGWNPGSVARGAWRGLQVFGQTLGNILLTLAIWSPVWIVILLALWFFWWRKRGKRK